MVDELILYYDARSKKHQITVTKSKDDGSKKPYNGRPPHDLSQRVVIEASIKWLIIADLFAETEGFLTAIQGQVILIKNYEKYILKQPNIDELCRRCGKESETIPAHYCSM